MAQELYADSCSICVGSLDENTVVEVAGEVDIATVSLLAKALDDAIHSGKGHVLVDAQELAYIDSAGLQTLLSTHQQLGLKGRKMAIVGAHGIFQRLMAISKLDTRFHTFPSLEEAISGLSSSD